MEIIPVIDLKEEMAWSFGHGLAGATSTCRLRRRWRRRAILSMCAVGLLGVHPFTTPPCRRSPDAIEAKGCNQAALQRLRTAFLPRSALWVDNGIGDAASAEAWLAAGLGHLGLGSEAQSDVALARRMAGEARIILSLDFRGEAFSKVAGLLADPSAWPKRICIGMTRWRASFVRRRPVSLNRLASLVALAPDRELHAAGGVRDLVDLRQLAPAGIAGALVASSPHDGRLDGRRHRQPVIAS